ncbi:MAG: hypothetical protein ACRD2B_13160, partial [Terriglobia bacterium]
DTVAGAGCRENIGCRVQGENFLLTSPFIERLKKSGLKKRSVIDPDSRFLKEPKGFTLGYTAGVAGRVPPSCVMRNIGLVCH